MLKCKTCGKELTQKRFSSGVLESPSMLQDGQKWLPFHLNTEQETG